LVIRYLDFMAQLRRRTCLCDGGRDAADGVVDVMTRPDDELEGMLDESPIYYLDCEEERVNARRALAEEADDAGS
jgi:hypothetical protein